MRTIVLSSAMLAVVASASVAQQVTSRTFSKPEVEYEEPFSQIVGIRELSDGRVMVADSRDKILQIIDFKGGAPKKVGREGSGPGEWLTLSRLLAYTGDTTLMPDAQNNRLLVIAPDGTPVRTISPATPPAGAGGGNFRIAGGGFVAARFADARGRLYYQDAAFSVGGPSGGAAPAIPDSAPVVRYDLRTQTSDTITFVKLALRGPSTTTSSGGATIAMSAPVPFSALDAWGALPDGRVAVAKPGDYHLEIATGRGPRAIGPKVQYTPVAVTAAEKKAYMDNLKATASQRRVVINGVAAPAPPPPEPAEWPAVMPPFLANAVSVSPTGDVWVLRARSGNDPVPTLDVFNADGRAIGRVFLPKGTTLAGFGAKSLYLYRTDDDGLQYLQRYALQGALRDQ